MFLPLSEKIDNELLVSNYEKIRDDYLNFLSEDKKYFFDYQHSWDLKFGLNSNAPENTGYFWQICPLIYGRHSIPTIFWHKEVEECFTTQLILSFKVKPILAIFSMLEPQSVVDPHTDHDHDLLVGFGYTNKKSKETIVKYHLTLDVPDDGQSILTVADESRVLKNGELNPFDESSKHSVNNLGSKRRGALIMSFPRSEIY